MKKVKGWLCLQESTGSRKNVVLKNPITWKLEYLPNKFYESLPPYNPIPYHVHLEVNDSIVATTNGYLDLPIIDPEFLIRNLSLLSNEKGSCRVQVPFNSLSENEIIGMIDFDNFRGLNGIEKQLKEIEYSKKLENFGILQVDEDNFVTPIKFKESFTRTEALQVALRASIENYDNLYDWFNENF